MPDRLAHEEVPGSARGPLANACDAHIHIYDGRFPAVGPILAGAAVNDYRAVQTRLGTTRAVVVQPRLYGTDNSVTLDAIRQLGPDRARGVAVVRPDVADDTLAALHAGGIRGIRFSLHTADHAVVGFDVVELLANRVAELGWHLQLHWTADQIVLYRGVLARLKSTVVFDHLARLPLPQGTTHPAFRVVAEMLGQGRAWLKLSGPYLDSVAGAADGYADMDPVARAWVRTAPERLVWGSDWPHPTEAPYQPDDTLLFDRLAEWAGTPGTRARILVNNPAELYGFDAA